MSTTTEKSDTAKVPSEFRLTLKWENALKRFGTYTAIGLFVGGASALVLFSKLFLAPYLNFKLYIIFFSDFLYLGGRGLRIAATTFGAGWGAGDAFRQNTIDFQKERDVASK